MLDLPAAFDPNTAAPFSTLFFWQTTVLSGSSLSAEASSETSETEATAWVLAADIWGSGVPILDTVTLPCTVKQTGDRTFTIILTQGLNRQIRRMCEYLGYKVTRLKRIRFMNISLGDLETGKWRYLTASEKKELLKDI